MVEEGSEIEFGRAVASYQSKSFIRWGFWTNIWITVMISMSVIFPLSAIGVPIIVTMILFFGATYFSILALSGKSIYTITDKGIRQELQPHWKKMKLVVRDFSWDEIKAYELGTDLNRSRQEYHFLHIDVHKTPGLLRLNDDKGDKESFRIFAEAFEKFANPAESANGYTPLATGSSQVKIRRKSGFYTTIWAKIFTIVLIIFCGFMVDFALRNGMREFNWYRLLVVVIPGTVYMIYRVFYKKAK